MSGIRVVGPGQGEMSGGGPLKVRIIEDGSHTGHRIGLIEAVIPPGPASPPQHFHRKHDEVFIITSGKLRFVSGQEPHDAPAGSVVVVPVGVPHTFFNPFDAPATMLCTLTPDVYIEYFRDLAKLPVNERGLLNPADVGRVMAAYDTHVVGPPAA